MNLNQFAGMTAAQVVRALGVKGAINPDVMESGTIVSLISWLGGKFWNVIALVAALVASGMASDVAWDFIRVVRTKAAELIGWR